MTVPLSVVFLATLGQRPEALTIAFDRLRERYEYASWAILHTDPEHSGIAGSFNTLMQVIERDYPGLAVKSHELRRPDHQPILDIATTDDAWHYYQALLTVLYTYKQQGCLLHLLISGGRKAMSVYSLLAAALVFRPPHDKVWVVLSPEKLIEKRGQFHVAGSSPLYSQIQMVDLPLVTARLPPGIDPGDVVIDRSRREQFMRKLSPEERVLAELLEKHPYESNDGLAKLLNKSPRTVENQLRNIYQKLTGFLDYGETISDQAKRLALLDTIRMY